MAFAHWELHSYLILVLGWVFAPFYLRAKIFTTPEFLERRYTPATRTFLSVIFLVSYVLTKASVTIFAGAFAIQTILGYDVISVPLFGDVDFFWFAALSLVSITGVFVVFGGMKSVLWTEAMHVPVLLIGSAVLLIVGLYRIGGLDALARGESRDHSPLAAALHDLRDAGFSGLSVRSQRDAVARRAHRLADHRAVVLVHGSVHRAACAHRPESDGSAPRHAVRRPTSSWRRCSSSCCRA
jgi:Na+(H+)/acetate symporter ActP